MTGTVTTARVALRTFEQRNPEFPHADAMRCVIHVEDMAEAFARVTLSDRPKHTTYNSGGHSVSMGELAAIVKEFLPQADIRFKDETGGRVVRERLR